jgi:mono/diheme cytochrome c family protein
MKLFKRIAMMIVCLITLFLIYVQFTYQREFDAPVTGIKSSLDSAVLARGAYLVAGQTHCYACHTPDSLQERGLREPLSGGHAFETPFGNIYTPNITPDSATGIGAWTDEELAQALRYNVNHNRRAMVGVMPFNSMSDDDLTAVISYLRTMKPVRREVPAHDINMLGKILMRFVIEPVQPEVSALKPDTTAAYGQYLAYSVANCNGCHTRRSETGGFEGDPFAGGNSWKEKDGTYYSPNLTPNDTVGRIAKWDYEVFMRRFRAGRLLKGSPMPWDNYQHISENDLKAIYNFLQTLQPSSHAVPAVYEPMTTASAKNTAENEAH